MCFQFVFRPIGSSVQVVLLSFRSELLGTPVVVIVAQKLRMLVLWMSGNTVLLISLLVLLLAAMRRVDSYQALMIFETADRELKEMIKQHLAQRHIAGLPLLVPQYLVTGYAADEILQLTCTEGRIVSNQGTTTLDQEEEEQPAKAVEQRILAIDHKAQEKPAQDKKAARIERQAQEHVEELSRVVENVDEAEAADSVEHQAHDVEGNQAKEEEH
ncbi:hypothetical protein F511_03709 [Dorcoceras hygrometricum]|uniref:Uncharacterized protein n=1 Tax=Dorcoceras hygrometricum TaxID=472368 RepID=A0A2Z7BKJ9_9LAMI|nr:hypothetical protein F511_03709 [Dorcoceras hygrometricum]